MFSWIMRYTCISNIIISVSPTVCHKEVSLIYLAKRTKQETVLVLLNPIYVSLFVFLVNIFGHLANVSELKEHPFYKLKNL